MQTRMCHLVYLLHLVWSAIRVDLAGDKTFFKTSARAASLVTWSWVWVPHEPRHWERSGQRASQGRPDFESHACTAHQEHGDITEAQLLDGRRQLEGSMIRREPHADGDQLEPHQAAEPAPSGARVLVWVSQHALSDPAQTLARGKGTHPLMPQHMQLARGACSHLVKSGLGNVAHRPDTPAACATLRWSPDTWRGKPAWVSLL